ncbi:hypothetical protein AVJ23_08605 [Pseudoponticoccus marisrubri]|uniref:Peptidase S8/S53 domain-containing protein n=2 Tax=Pseudoponticoccus marisrubri TaxID=1685382 RepID=A0A0W7WL47_9RHOB|nr:hypothetical protein AVJ23_08605 [Pseudoponticoccus marisrubri]
MAMHWTDPETGGFRDAYLDWARLLQRRRDALPPARPVRGIEYEPIFVRLTTDHAPATQRQRLRQAVEDPEGPLLMDAHEHERLTDPAPLPGLAEEYALYRPMGTPDSDHHDLFTVLDTGSPVWLDTAPAGPVETAEIPPSPHPGAPIVALIDDGIGFLNARFRRRLPSGGYESRFHAIWLQAQERGHDARRRVLAGDVLGKPEIDVLLQAGAEGDHYAALNARLFPCGTRRATNFGTSHGTHVLDLAAGADAETPDTPAARWPLLGVQLPPEAVEDTSGTRLESYMLQGLRWILQAARKVDPAAPVIVNLSLGIVAGPKDGSRFIEYQMAREASLWEAATGQPVRLVWAFGNNRRSRLVAAFPYEAAAPRHATDREVTWRVQPDDHSASFVEIHPRGAESGQLQVALTAPDGTGSGFHALRPGEMRSLLDGESPVARIYHVPSRDFGTGVQQPAHYVLALAPTAGRRRGEPTAPHGAWQVHTRLTSPDAAEVLLQIQRDDSRGGGSLQARQSYFDDPAAHAWEDETASHAGHAAGCPVTPAGSHSALVTAPARQVFSVGAAQWSPRTVGMSAENLRPARYSAQGAAWSVPGPTLACIAEGPPFRPGSLGSGTLSGSARHQGGTSAAAGRLSRALALSLATSGQPRGGSGHLEDFDPEVVTLIPVPQELSDRMSAVIVSAHDPTRLPC